MTEEELEKLEVYLCAMARPFRSEIKSLIAEIRRQRQELAEATQLMQDLSQDNVTVFETILRCLDAVKRVVPVGEATTETLGTIRECARAVARLANVSEEEVEEEIGAAPIVYDANQGFRGHVVDAATGASMDRWFIARACPVQGWYERYLTDSGGVIVSPPQVVRVYHDIRVVLPSER